MFGVNPGKEAAVGTVLNQEPDRERSLPPKDKPSPVKNGQAQPKWWYESKNAYELKERTVGWQHARDELRSN